MAHPDYKLTLIFKCSTASCIHRDKCVLYLEPAPEGSVLPNVALYQQMMPEQHPKMNLFCFDYDDIKQEAADGQENG